MLWTQRIWHLLLGIHASKPTAHSLGSFTLTERVRGDRTRSPALTHEQQGQAIEESANVSQEPHQDRKLKKDMMIRASKTIVTDKSLISLTSLDENLRQTTSWFQ